MTVVVRHGDQMWQFGDGDLREYLVRRFGADQAMQLYGHHQLLLRSGPAETQRLLGPERYVEVVVMLRGAGLDI